MMRLIKISAIFIVFLSSCNMNSTSSGDLKTIDSLNTVLADKEMAIKNNLNLLDSIDVALKEVSSNQYLSISEPEKAKAIDKEIFDKISSLRTILETDKNKIEQLQEQLNKARESADYRKDLINKISDRMEGLKKENVLLQQQIADGTQNISNLTQELEEQGVKIGLLRNNLLKMNEDIVLLKTQLNEVYFKVGSRKALKNDSIIVKRGIGGSTTLNENIDYSKFKKIDKRSNSSISLTGFKKVELIPMRPESSYSLKTEDGLIVGIVISDPGKFWETSKYLVIEVK